MLGSLGELVEVAAPPEVEAQDDGERDEVGTDGEDAVGGEDGRHANESYAARSPRVLLTCRDALQHEDLLDVIDRLIEGEKVTLTEIKAAFDGATSRSLSG